MQKIRLGFSVDTKYFDKEHNWITDILRKKYDVEICDNPDFMVCHIFGKEHRDYNGVRIFWTGENYVPDFNEFDYAISFEDMQYLDRNLRVPYYYTSHRDPIIQAKIAEKWSDEQLLNRKFCNFVYSNSKYSNKIRKEFFHLLSEYKRVDAGGACENNVGGRVPDKYEFQKQYKFSIAFENASHYGYTTEKIYDAFVAKTIPIYWGNPDVVKEFNPEAFINVHNYNSLDEVIAKVKELDNDDAAYLKMVKTPFLKNGKLYQDLDDDKILAFFDNIFAKGKDFFYRMNPRPEQFESGEEVCSFKNPLRACKVTKGYKRFIKIISFLTPVKQWRKNLRSLLKY